MVLFAKMNNNCFLKAEDLKTLVNCAQKEMNEIDLLEIENTIGSSNDESLFFKDVIKFLRKTSPSILALSSFELFNYDTLLSSKDAMDLGNQPLADLPNWNEVFDALIGVPSTTLNFYITQLECSNEKKNILSYSLLERKRDIFLDCVSKMGKESYPLKNLSDTYVLSVGKRISPDKFNLDNINQYLFLYVDSFVKEFFPNMHEAMIRIRNSNNRKNTLLFEVNQGSFHYLPELLISLYQFLYERYKENKGKYPKEVIDYIDSIIEEPENIPLYNKIVKRGYKYLLKEQEGIKETAFEDLIIFDNIPNYEKKDYFNGLDFRIVNEGDEKFREFVNYIASSGYIENTTKVKQLFTFRLTGRCKPMSIEKIIWDGREGKKANELIYIIRYATDNSKNKYKRMKEFFEGPEFPDNNISSYGDQARIEFRNKLHSLYPTVFKIKDISQY